MPCAKMDIFMYLSIPKKIMYQSSMYRNCHVPKTPYPGLAGWSHAGYIS